MGLLSKIMYGNKKIWKVIVKCDNREHGCVKIAVIDLKNNSNLDEIKDRLKAELCSSGCDKCTIEFEEISAEELKSAGKVFEVIKF